MPKRPLIAIPVHEYGVRLDGDELTIECMQKTKNGKRCVGVAKGSRSDPTALRTNFQLLYDELWGPYKAARADVIHRMTSP